MEEISHPPCESNVKTSSSVVSHVVAKVKPLFHTPSHHQINQMRLMMRDNPKDTPKDRRLAIMHQPNFSNRKVRKTCFAYMHIALPFGTKTCYIFLYLISSHYYFINQEKKTYTTQALSQEVEQEGVLDKETPSLFLYNSSENLNDKIVKERTMEDKSCSVSTNTNIGKEK